MTANDDVLKRSDAASRLPLVENARKLPVATIAAKLVRPSGTFMIRWRASARAAAYEVSAAFVVKGDRAWLRLSPDLTTSVRLQALQQPRGGRRWIFVEADGRRCTALYQPTGETRFASRAAWGLAYKSQSTSRRRRAANRATSIRLALGGSADISQPLPERPAGMHHRTYERLAAAAEAAAAIALDGRRALATTHREPTP